MRPSLVGYREMKMSKLNIPSTYTVEEVTSLAKMWDTWHKESHDQERRNKIQNFRKQLKYLIGSVPGGFLVWLGQQLIE